MGQGLPYLFVYGPPTLDPHVFIALLGSNYLSRSLDGVANIDFGDGMPEMIIHASEKSTSCEKQYLLRHLDLLSVLV